VTRAPLVVDADLTLSVPGGDVTVTGYGDVVVVEASSLRAVRSLLSGAETVPLETFGHGLETAGLTVDVRVGGYSVARAGVGATPGLVSRAVGATPARIGLAGLALAALRRYF
jgi:hypothetical protein